MIYATEEYFSELNKQSRLIRAHEASRVNWRETLEEAKVKDGASDEGAHPYVSIMPHKDSKEKEVKKKMKQNDDLDKSISDKLPESVNFEDALQNLIEAEKPFDPDARRKQRGAMLKKLAQNAPKDTRTDAQKMADATGPRPGSRYRGD